MYILFALLLSVSSYGAPTCGLVDQKKNSAPACPAESNILSDDYPAIAVSVSDDEGGPTWVNAFVKKILAAQPDAPPQFLLNVRTSTFESVKKQIAQSASSPEQKALWLASLTRIQTSAVMNWQQDFYQDFDDPATGLPKPRYVTGYGEGTKGIFNAMMKSASACGIKVGKPMPLEPDTDGYTVAGAYGGNLEGIPPGLCAVGTDSLRGKMWDKYSREVCGTRAHGILKPPTAWLEVGHTDEVFKAVAVPNRPPPCNTVYLLASPRKARELMAANAKTPAFQMPKRLGPKEARTFFKDYEIFDYLCQDYLGKRRHPQKGKPGKAPSNATSWLEILPKANAVTSVDCQDMTNQDLTDAASKFKTYNDIVQAQLDDFRKSLVDEVKRANPDCEPDILEVPDLFAGEMVLDKKTKKLSLASESGASIFPNPSNAVSFSDTLISSEPYNAAFKDYLVAEYQKRGIKPEFVDTMFAHVIGGNAHCSSQVLRYCKPRN